MLCLGRKVGQRTKITTPSGEIIVVTVVTNERGKLVLGFSAHKSVAIEREEICQEPITLPAFGGD